MGMQKFLKGRLAFVKQLLQSDLDWEYGDVMLITCAVLSACATQRWPRQTKGMDKEKFVKLLQEYSPAEFRTSWVSVPSLLYDGLISERETPWSVAGNECRVFRDDEVDLSMDEAPVRFPRIRAETIREYSYASLIYKHLRCTYSHEYRPHPSINEKQASWKEARVSYIGRSSINGVIERRVSFHLDYLLRLAEFHVSILLP